MPGIKFPANELRRPAFGQYKSAGQLQEYSIPGVPNKRR